MLRQLWWNVPIITITDAAFFISPTNNKFSLLENEQKWTMWQW